jgi:hypothetical protein
MALQNSFFFFKELTQNLQHQEGERALLRIFNGILPKANILFYPSSGDDINDLLYIRLGRINHEKFVEPDVYIHCDYMQRFDIARQFEGKIKEPNFSIKSSYYFKRREDRFREVLDKDQQICLYQLKTLTTNKTKWLIFFRGFYNEEILDLFIKNNHKIPFIYSVCDGITHGMGSSNYINPIPTILYPLFAEQLGIKYLLTEQDFIGVSHLIHHEQVNTLRQYLSNIANLTGNQMSLDLLDMDDLNLRSSLHRYLEAVHEEKVNGERLRVFDNRFSDQLVLKILI